MGTFEDTLRGYGAREFEIVALSADEERALAALAEAERRGATRPLAYALTLFENEDWAPSGARPVRRTNLAVERQCELCSGDRFVVSSTRKPQTTGWMAERGIEAIESEEIEEYRPCPQCNPDANVSFWRADGSYAR